MKFERLANLSLPRPVLGVYLGYVAVLLLIFSGLATAQSPQFIGAESTDLYQQFLSWRAFGFAQLAAGHLPLWNPHIFSGAPFLGGFQSALFYPLNWIYLVLPLTWAVNLGIVLHLLLLAGLMFHWAQAKRLGVTASALAGLIVMLSGAYFLHIYAGHLSNLCSMAWIPLVLRATESVLDASEQQRAPADARRWALIGAAAVCMQILAGHPQYVYYCAVTVVLLCLSRANLFWRSPALIGQLAWIPGIALLLAAVQILPGLQTMGETLRSHPLPYAYAAAFSFPPENIATAVLPNVWGTVNSAHYYGRAFLWEMSLFVGATTVFLALTGLARSALAQEAGQWSGTTRLRYAGMIVVLLLLALGKHTALHRLLYDFLPGFASFRGASKFNIFVTVYLALLAGRGMDLLLRGQRCPRWAAGLLAACALALLLLALSSQAENVQPLVHWMANSGEVYALGGIYQQTIPAESERMVLRYIAQNIQLALLLGAAPLLALAVLLRLGPRFARGVALLAALELVLYAYSTVSYCPAQDPILSQERAFQSTLTDDVRIANSYLPDHAMLTGAQDVDGVDPNVLTRYSELMHFAEGVSADSADPFTGFKEWNKLYDLVRLGFVMTLDTQFGLHARPVGQPLPHAFFVENFQLLTQRDAIFATLKSAAFDPRTSAVLERPPVPMPAHGVLRKVALQPLSTDEMALDVELDAPALLVVSDLYSPAWKLTLRAGSNPIPGGEAVQLVPVDYILRGAALPAGKYQLLMYYERGWLRTGAALSLLGVCLWLIVWRRSRAAPRRADQDAGAAG